MKHAENKAALVWFSEQLRKIESGCGKGHAQIVIDIVDKKAHNLAVTDKTLVRDLVCKNPA